MSTGLKIVVGKGKAKEVDMAQATQKLKNDVSELLEYIAVLAEIRKKSYDIHLKQGFTPQQALELCRNIV